MNISRRSWHYRLYRVLYNVGRGPKYLSPFAKGRVDPDLPSSLCPYAWSILLALVGATVLAVVFVALAPVAGVLYAGYWLGSVLVVPASVWVVHGIVRYVNDPEAKESRHRDRKPREPRPSLVANYLRARKQKVCPPVRLVD